MPLTNAIMHLDQAMRHAGAQLQLLPPAPQHGPDKAASSTSSVGNGNHAGPQAPMAEACRQHRQTSRVTNQRLSNTSHWWALVNAGAVFLPVGQPRLWQKGQTATQGPTDWFTP